MRGLVKSAGLYPSWKSMTVMGDMPRSMMCALCFGVGGDADATGRDEGLRGMTPHGMAWHCIALARAAVWSARGTCRSSRRERSVGESVQPAVGGIALVPSAQRMNAATKDRIIVLPAYASTTHLSRDSLLQTL